MIKSINKTLQKIPAWPLYIIGIIPFAVYFYWALTNQLGADPAKELEHQLGIWALQLLILVLLITPLREITKLNLVKYRRAIGVLSFVYVVLHFSAYIILDKQFFWGEIFTDVTERPYIIIGVLCMLMLLPLAVTSNNFSIRKLGGKQWKKLHKLVYLAVPAAAIHYLLLVKVWSPKPFVYFFIILALLGYRYYKFREKKKVRADSGQVGPAATRAKTV